MMLIPRSINLGDHKIGTGNPCFVIAEAGVNHNGDIDLAKRLVNVALHSGADAVKFQTFKADSLATKDAPKAIYQEETTGTTESQFEMLKRLELTLDMHQELYQYCRDLGIMFLSSPFDEDSADLLEELGVQAYKIPSGEITNLPFLEHVAVKNKPMLVSTGMADISEVSQAVDLIQNAGNAELILLHCVSNYPAYASEINLNAMDTMRRAFRLPIGYSDHTLGLEVAWASVALGANVLEKHFTLDVNLEGPDHRASLAPQELAALVKGVRTIESSLGDGRKIPTVTEYNTASVARKSIVATIDIIQGQVITTEMVSAKRPGTGLPPPMIRYIVGRSANQFIAQDELIDWEKLV